LKSLSSFGVYKDIFAQKAKLSGISEKQGFSEDFQEKGFVLI
jgi:hypothetical protein